MENERCETGFDFVDDDDQILHNTTTITNNNDNNNNSNLHEKQQNEDHDLFLPTNINGKNNAIQHFSTNGMCSHEQIDHQFLHIQTTSSSSLSSSGTPNQEQGPVHDTFLAQQISSSHLLAGSKNNNNNKDPLVTICGKGNGSSKNSGNGNGSSSSGATGTATMNNNNKEQDRFLPIANVGRIMKKFIPGNGKISKDAKETVQECVSEFISFVTGEASDKCQREKRKTINGDDIIWAITTLGFEDYVNPLKHYLQKYRELEGEKLNNVPKPQRTTSSNNNGDHHHHHLFHQQQQNPTTNMNNNYTHNMYHHHPASTTLLPPPQTTSSYVPNDQPFPLPFSQTSNIQTRLPQHEHIDSVANW